MFVLEKFHPPLQKNDGVSLSLFLPKEENNVVMLRYIVYFFVMYEVIVPANRGKSIVVSYDILKILKSKLLIV